MEELTYGQKMVGLSFNPSGKDDVTRVKQLYAEIIDILNNDAIARNLNGQPDTAELFTYTKMQALSAQMIAVKQLTWKN